MNLLKASFFFFFGSNLNLITKKTLKWKFLEDGRTDEHLNLELTDSVKHHKYGG